MLVSQSFLVTPVIKGKVCQNAHTISYVVVYFSFSTKNCARQRKLMKYVKFVQSTQKGRDKTDYCISVTVRTLCILDNICKHMCI